MTSITYFVRFIMTQTFMQKILAENDRDAMK